MRNQQDFHRLRLILSPALIVGIGVATLLASSHAGWGQTAPDQPQSTTVSSDDQQIPIDFFNRNREPDGISLAGATFLAASSHPVARSPGPAVATSEPAAAANRDQFASGGSSFSSVLVEVPQSATPDSNPNSVILEPAESEPLDGIAPAGAGQTIANIQVEFLNRKGEIVEGHTHPSVFTRELNLQTGTSYDQAQAQQGLDRISRLDIVRAADIQLEPIAASEQVTLVIRVRERSSFVAGLGVISPSPSALQGPFQQNPTLGIGPDEVTGVSAEANLRLLNLGGNDQDLTLQLRGGENVFDTELALTDPWIGNDPTGIAVNVFNQRSIQGVFDDGDRDVDLPNGNTPWVHRIGGGVEVFHPVASNFVIALGANYQRVSIHNSAFEDDTFSRDEDGNQLTVSDSGYDDLLTGNFSADFDRRDDPVNPTTGTRFRFGVDQAIPIGDANINYTRLSANFAQYIPLNLFGFARGPRTLVVNAQAGKMFGEIPPYEAFNLSSGLLRGYAGDPIGTGSSFALLAAEYRFPIANFSVFRRDVRLGGTLFGGYGTVFGTENEVIGDPSTSRDKPGDTWGYGLGLRALTNFGVLRLEFSLSGAGDSQVVFTIGDRF